MIRFKRLSIVLTSALALSALGLIGEAAPASAKTPVPYPAKTVYKVVDKTKTTYYVDKTQELASCKILTAGGTCTASKSTAATRSVQISTGVSREGVTASLGISSALTVGVAVSCTSPKMSKNQLWRAWAMGTRHKYRVQKTYTPAGRNAKPNPPTYSGWLYTFDPGRNSFACG
ncbi:MAG: hypothetical protein LBG60_02225 [Bifidobacteriaceae bacterium]|jgi:hypothetical protein|nr:hypothetical protein [Bifidobacteriaceae bacterium]